MQTIHRSQIQHAPYNPRKIKEEAKKKLKKELKEMGLMAPLVYNLNTGNLVSGHQRLTILDTLEKKDDYELTVAVVNLPEDKEVKANVLFNNPSVMGEWDTDKLQEIHESFPELDFLKDFGFDRYDIDFMDLDVLPKIAPIDTSTPEGVEKALEAEEKKQEMIEKMREQKKEYREQQKAKQTAEGGGGYGEQNDYTVTFVFNTNAEKWEFLKKIGVKHTEKFVKATKLFDIIQDQFKF